MKSTINFLAIVLLISSSIMLFGCGDDEKDTSCANFPTLNGEVEINGEVLQLSAFQSLSSAGGSNFGDSYSFQVGGITSDCNTLKTFSVNVIVPSGTSVTGSYDIKTFFEADEGDASGSFTSQTLDPIIQSAVDMNSGTLTVNDKGDSQFDLDITATLLDGSMVSLSIEN